MMDVTLRVRTVDTKTHKVFVTEHEFPDRDMALIITSELFRCFEPKHVGLVLKSTKGGDFEMTAKVYDENHGDAESVSDYIARRVDIGIVTMVLEALKN